VGVDLKIVNIESDEGASLNARFHLSGVSCLIVSSDTTIYGVQQKYEDAKKLLQTALKKDE